VKLSEFSQSLFETEARVGNADSDASSVVAEDGFVEETFEGGDY